MTTPAAGLGRDRRQDRTKGLRYGEHFEHHGGDATWHPRRGATGSGARSGRDPTRTGSTFPPRSSTRSSSSSPPSASFYFSFTRWDLFTSTWIGLKNYQTFFNEQALIIGLRNTLIYAVITSGLKVVLGMALALLLTSKIIARGYLRSVIFFPVLVSTIGVGLTFTVLMNPEQGLINKALGVVGIDGPGWLTNPSLAMFSDRPGRRLERRRPRHRHLHRRARLDSAGVLRGGRGDGASRWEHLPAHHAAARPTGHRVR